MEKNKSKRRLETFSSLPHNRSRKKAPEGSGTKKVQLGWLHYSDRRKRYVAVRQIKGGGTRDISLSIDATADSIIEAGKELFFPGGISSFGSIDMMEFTLANYKEDTISDVVVRGSVLPFTLQRYFNATKLPGARLYLALKQRKCESEEDGDDSLLQPMLDLTNIRRHHPEEDTTFPERPLVDHYQASDECKDVILLSSVTSLKANRDLIAEQNKDYQYSLLADQKKEEERGEKLLSEIRSAEQQEQLRQARLHRVPDVPKGGSIVLIQVRHVTLGVIKRNFSSNDKMWSVYDWVASLSLLPPYFELSDFRGQVLRSEQSVIEGEKSTLNTSASECTPSLDDEKIDFKGFGTTEENNDDTLSLLDWLPPVASVPLVEQMQDLIPEACGSGERLSSPGMQFRQVYLPLLLESQGLSGDFVVAAVNLEMDAQTDNSETPVRRIVNVHRSLIKEDLIKLLADPTVLQQELDWRVIDNHGRQEEGVGSGVQRDILATFWPGIFSSLTLRDVEKVPCIRHDHQKTEWEAICRVLVYGYRFAGYVPICLSSVFLASCIYGEESISKEVLLTLFMYYVTAYDREVLTKCLSGDLDCQDDDLLEFLSSYKSFKLPNKDNLKVLLMELAHQEIIQKPRYVAQCWSPIIISLKSDLHFCCVKSIKELFLDLSPNAKKVIKALQPKANNESKKESFDFQRQFIKSLDRSSLKGFLKFVTGSDVLLKDQKISVAFYVVDGLARRPIAHTCGPLLEVPCTYQSYNELAEEFTNIMREKEEWTFNIV